MTDWEIDEAFVAGRDAMETAVCPHHPATTAAHWWTRGFSYTARDLRAIRAEDEVKQLLAALIAVLPFIDDASDVHDMFPERAASNKCRAAVAAAKAAIAKAGGATP